MVFTRDFSHVEIIDSPSHQLPVPKRLALIWSGAAVAGLIVFLITWNSFFTYVPPGKHLVIIAKNGKPLPPGQVLAEKGQKGIQREVLGEGWHFVMPIIYTTELEDNTIVKPGQVGIVTARGGKPLPEGRAAGRGGRAGHSARWCCRPAPIA